MNTKFIACAVVAGFTIIAANPSLAGEPSERMECSARGPHDISMQARYESRRVREKFTVEFEAGPRSLMIAGEQIGVMIENVLIAKITLKQIASGDVVGELDFDSTAGPFDNNAPFPASWPGVKSGAEVELVSGRSTLLACELKG